jgi:gas vesicle protein
MSYSERDNAAGFTAGLVAGAIVGAGVALMLAPRSGADLREDLSESWTTLLDAVGRRYRALADKAGVELENIQEKIDQAADSFESGANAVVEAAAGARRAAGKRARRDNA